MDENSFFRVLLNFESAYFTMTHTPPKPIPPNPHPKPITDRCPPLSVAMKILLEEGADPEKETSRGRTALDCALAADRDSSRPVVRLLQARLKGKICIEAPINE